MRELGKTPENVIYGEAGRAGSLLLSCKETLLLSSQFRQGTRFPRHIAKLRAG